MNTSASTAGGALQRYDAGLLNDYGGGNVDWWQDYIRAELDRAYDSYETQWASAIPASTPAEQGWQDIASAPKDGRTMLLGYPNKRGKWRTVRGQWFSEAEIAETWEDEGVEGWYETSEEAEDIPNCWSIEPTHWMPLPPSPVSHQAQQEKPL